MQAVERVSRIMRALAAAPDGLTVAATARAAHLAPTPCHRLLRALEAEGLTVRDAVTKRYCLGREFVRLSSTVLPISGMRPDVQWTLRHLQSRWSECFFVGVLVDGEIVLLRPLDLDSQQRFSVERPLGWRVPKHAASAAKAILAQLPPEVAAEILARQPLNRYTRHTKCEISDILADLAATRDRGFAVCDEETDLGTVAYAAPVIAPLGEAPRSLGVVGSRDRLIRASKQGLLDELITAADELSSRHEEPLARTGLALVTESARGSRGAPMLRGQARASARVTRLS